MNLLRESHEKTLADGFTVTLEVSHLKKMTVDLLYSFIEAWLFKNCKSPWDLTQLEEVAQTADHKVHTYIRIVFKDVREALYFKMGPHSLYSKPEMPLFVCFHSNTVSLSGPALI
jgi:hypothetical protein